MIANIHHPLFVYDGLFVIPKSTLDTKSPALLVKLLKSAISHRLTSLSLLPDSCFQSPDESSDSGSISDGVADSDTEQSASLFFAFKANPVTLHQSIDHGPTPQQSEDAANFRCIWGEKAQLRRFKSGLICESLHWTNSSTPVISQILVHLIRIHFCPSFSPGSLYLHLDPLSPLLPNPSSSRTTLPIVLFEPFFAAFHSLKEHILSLSLPLPVNAILPNDSQFAYASLQLPTSSGERPNLPAEVLIDFVSSSKWPNHLPSLQFTKLAFLLKIKQLLTDRYSHLYPSLSLRLENSDDSLLNQGYLDVQSSANFVFRIRIRCQHELGLILLQPSSSLWAENYKREYIHRPVHYQSIQSAVQKFPLLSATIRLLKLWFASHLLLSPQHFREEVVEIFAAAVFFLCKNTENIPATATLAFFQTLLLLAKWDWRNSPWLVNFGELEESSVNTVKSHTDILESWRKNDTTFHNAVLYVASSAIPDGGVFTKPCRPSLVLASRLSALSRAAVEFISAWKPRIITNFSDTREFSRLLIPDVSDYDFCIHINPSPSLPCGSLNHSQRVKQLYEELSRVYSNCLVLFYNPYEGVIDTLENHETLDIIAGLWIPTTLERRWKVKLGFSTLPASDGNNAILNKPAILHEICRIGGDLICQLKTQTQN